MRRVGGKPKEKRIHACPQCKKNRMSRDLDHEVTLEKREYKARDGNTVELFIDICEWCKQRNWHRHFEPTRADIKRVLKTMQEEAQLSEDQSLEDLL